jgi:hypothetical protein
MAIVQPRVRPPLGRTSASPALVAWLAPRARLSYIRRRSTWRRQAGLKSTVPPTVPADRTSLHGRTQCHSMGLGQPAVACSPQPALTDATNMCPSDIVQVQYPAADYSPEPVTITANYWCSTDDTWQQSETLPGLLTRPASCGTGLAESDTSGSSAGAQRGHRARLRCDSASPTCPSTGALSSIWSTLSRASPAETPPCGAIVRAA